jgi:4-amino-4-deoxy-L-arabinose transferase-like glycosyltransferase
MATWPISTESSDVMQNLSGSNPRSKIDRLAARPDLVATMLLLSMALIGAAIRFTGIEWGRPFVYHPDEAIIVKTAMQMVATNDWNPHDFNYPSLVIEVDAGIVAIGHVVAGWPLATYQIGLFGAHEALPQQFDAFLTSRIVVAFLGITTIIVTYAIGRRLGGRIAGLVAAAIVALAPTHIESSRYAMTDVPVTLLCALVLLASIRASEEPGRTRWWVISAALVGLATSAKWNGVAVGIVPCALFVSSCVRYGGVSALIRSRTPWLMLLAGVLALVLTTPALIFAPGEVINGLRQQAVLYGAARGPGDANGLFLQIQMLTDGFGPIGFVLTAVAWVALLAGRRRIEWAIALFIGIYVVILSLPVVYYPRNSLPALPFIGVAIGLLPGHIDSLARRWRVQHHPLGRWSASSVRVRVAVTILIALAIIPALSLDVADAREFRKQDTRSVAYYWLVAHLPHNAIIAREQYTPQLAASDFPSRNHDGLYQRSIQWYRDQHVEYLIASSAIYLRYLGNPDRPFDDAFYRALFALPEVFHVDADGTRPGPTIRVFRLVPIPSTGSATPSALELGH